ncbi:hypothetical protein [Streptomyces sp. NPDC001480]|uniref:hypothetical protein n=1 Tax=Streptomyces sp. NPDC001480 TaxID=3364577 RepID=UPI003695EDF7
MIARPRHRSHEDPKCLVLTRVTLAGLPNESDRTRSWPLPGGAPAWGALAAAVMFQFPGD